jgi:hypothetical protein
VSWAEPVRPTDFPPVELWGVPLDATDPL